MGQSLLEKILDTWDYSDPKTTESEFSKMLETLDAESQKDQYLEIITQIARAKGLQMEFVDGHELLDKCKFDFLESSGIPKIRYHLERGRLYNSDNDTELARKEFEVAWSICQSNENVDYLQVDVAHMIAFVKKNPKQAIQWNEMAIEICEESDDPIVKKWLGSLYNNTGWSYHDMEEYERAVELFEKAYEYFKGIGIKDRIRVAKWTIGRAKRSLGEIDEAMEIMHELEQEFIENDLEVGGYTLEELGELYLIMNEIEKSRSYFGKAYEALSKDQWLQKNEQDRLNRLKELSIDH